MIIVYIHRPHRCNVIVLVVSYLANAETKAKTMEKVTHLNTRNVTLRH